MKLKLIRNFLKEIKAKEKAGIKLSGFDVKFGMPNDVITIQDDCFNLCFIVKFRTK